MNEEKRKQLEKALSFLDGKQEEMMGLLERLVKQESGNPDKEGCDAMCALMEEQLKKLGAKTTVVSMEKKGNFLYGEIGGERPGKPVLFGGHMDTVFREEPYRIRRGVWKMAGRTALAAWT